MRPLVYLIGATLRERASIRSAACSDSMQLEAVASVAQLTPQVLRNVDVFLAWDEGELIAQLKTHLSIVAHRAPIIAIAEQPSVRQIVRALVSGSSDFLEWPCSSEALLEAVSVAVETTARSLPLQQRAVEARRLLAQLSGPERQVLTAMAQGMSNQAIAELLELHPSTVETHRRTLLATLGVEHSAEAIRLELEGSQSVERDRQSDWMAPWQSGAERTGSN